MEETLNKKMEEMELKINEIYKVTMLAKKMLIWSTVISLLLFIIPLIILLVMLPAIMGSFSSMYGGLL